MLITPEVLTLGVQVFSIIGVSTIFYGVVHVLNFCTKN